MELFDGADADGDGRLNEAEYSAFIAAFKNAQAEKYGEWVDMSAEDTAIIYGECNKISDGEGLSKDDMKVWRSTFREIAAEIGAQ